MPNIIIPGHVLITETHHNKQVKFAFNIATGMNYNMIMVMIDYVIAYEKIGKVFHLRHVRDSLHFFKNLLWSMKSVKSNLLKEAGVITTPASLHYIYRCNRC